VKLEGEGWEGGKVKGERGRLGREGFGGGGGDGLRGGEVSDLGFWEGKKGKAGGRRGLESGKVI
jgi:hypothetical protein